MELKLKKTTDPEVYNNIVKQLEMMKRDNEEGRIAGLL